MHPEARAFLNFVLRTSFPNVCKAGRMLDCGSGDINGNNRGYKGAEMTYVGNDIAPGRNVDVVCETGKLEYPDGHFDLVVSSECFEHDAHFAESLRNIHRMLKANGLLVFTCASLGRAEHGTRRTTPSQSLGSVVAEFSDYYRNLMIEDVAPALPLDAYDYRAFYNSKSKDLYFVGIKKGAGESLGPVQRYVVEGVYEVTGGTPAALSAAAQRAEDNVRAKKKAPFWLPGEEERLLGVPTAVETTGPAGAGEAAAGGGGGAGTA